jgi:hypothetical protein
MPWNTDSITPLWIDPAQSSGRLSSAELAEYNQSQRGTLVSRVPFASDEIAGSNARYTCDSLGLNCYESVDDSNRKIREFAYPTPDHPKTWMDAFKAPPQLMLFLNKDGKRKATLAEMKVDYLRNAQKAAREGVIRFDIERARGDAERAWGDLL